MTSLCSASSCCCGVEDEFKQNFIQKELERLNLKPKNGTGNSALSNSEDKPIIENKESEIKIISGASANDANHISGPSRTAEGLFMSINKTFEQHKNIQPDFISAHGTATEFNDEMESIAFAKAGFEKIPMHSLKGYYGHTLGAAGVLETIISIESLKNNTLIPSRGFENPGTSKELNIITKLEKKSLHSFLKTSSGFGGSNATILIQKN